MTLTLGSMFTGCGGMELGVELVLECELIWYAENNRGASKIAARHHPTVPNLGNVTKIDWRRVEPVDVLIGGPPCQPISKAGLGLGSADPRWMWPEALRAMFEMRPAFTLWESPAQLLTGKDEDDDDAGGDPGAWGVGGSAVDAGWFGWILGQMAEEGFDARWTCVRSSDVGAPHKRDRVFVAAIPVGETDWPAVRHGPPRDDAEPVTLLPTPTASDAGRGPDYTRDQREEAGGSDLTSVVAQQMLLPTPTARDATGSRGRDEQGRFYGPTSGTTLTDAAQSGDWWGRYELAVRRWERLTRPAPPPLDDTGRLNPALSEWMLGFPEGWVTGPGTARTTQLRILGNSCQPQVAAAALIELGVDRMIQPAEEVQ